MRYKFDWSHEEEKFIVPKGTVRAESYMQISNEKDVTHSEIMTAVIGANDGSAIMVDNEEQNTNIMNCMKLYEYVDPSERGLQRKFVLCTDQRSMKSTLNIEK